MDTHLSEWLVRATDWASQSWPHTPEGKEEPTRLVGGLLGLREGLWEAWSPLETSTRVRAAPEAGQRGLLQQLLGFLQPWFCAPYPEPREWSALDLGAHHQGGDVTVGWRGELVLWWAGWGSGGRCWSFLKLMPEAAQILTVLLFHSSPRDTCSESVWAPKLPWSVEPQQGTGSRGWGQWLAVTDKGHLYPRLHLSGGKENCRCLPR